MHTHSIEQWRLSHDFLPPEQRAVERRVQTALVLTIIMMIAELIVGYASHSLALTADGWHTGSHAIALGISIFAYAFSRYHVNNTRYTFGTGKVGMLAGYTSALLLMGVGISMAVQSLWRLWHPAAIAYDEAIGVAVLGFMTNFGCAWLLRDQPHDHHGHNHTHDHHHEHEHAHDHDDEHDHHEHTYDHNLHAAYIHMFTDALTSLLAIVALLSAKHLGWLWMDAAMGLVGAVLVGSWSIGLIRSSARALLDAEDNQELVEHITQDIESDADNRIADLHVWRLGPHSYGCIVSLVTHTPQPAAHYKALLADISELKHITVEVNVCCTPDKPAFAPIHHHH